MNFLEKLQYNCLNDGKRECLCDGTVTLNYEELWKLSGQVYAYINSKGITKEQVVMISMDRNVYALVCIVGILRSNAVFVVMGQDYPDERKEYIKKDSGCVLEITEDVFKEILHTEVLSGFEDRAPHDLAYLVHTSGTSGNPKCVMHEFGGIKRCCAIGNAEEDNLCSAEDRMAIMSPINFVGCIYWLFYALFRGAKFVLVPKMVLNNLNTYKGFLEENKITAAFMTPSLLKTIGKLPDVVKSAFIFGEAAKEIYYDDINLYNFYSQSKLGSLGVYFKIDKVYEIAPIGLPCDVSTEFRILDDQNNPVPEGSEGELCMDNPYFRGYMNLPEQTSKALSGGIYHTGDVVRKNEDGQLVLLHRKDTMVKINGNRVELTEIENKIKEITGGKWSAVNACNNGNVTYLCAYYVDELEISIDNLKKEMAKSLATYMLPSFYVKLDKIPLNANGKFSRRLLPDPDFSTLRKEYRAPENDIEKKIINAFERVLNVERIGIDEDFFELGGDSLSAINVITELNIPNLLTTDIFSLRNARALGARCIELMKESADEEEKSALPLVGTQNFLRLYHEKLSESTAYNLSLFYKLKDDIDLLRLKESISEVMQRHQAFRIRIRKNGRNIEQFLADEIILPEIIKTSEKELEILKENMVVPYKLYDSPLYKIKIYSTETNAYLFCEMHHIITDGTSMQIMLKEFEDAYAGKPIKDDRYFKIIQNRVSAQNSDQYRIDFQYFLPKVPSVSRTYMPKFDFIDAGNVPGTSNTRLKLSEQDIRRIKEHYELTPTEFFIMCYLVALSRITSNSKVGTTYTVNGRISSLTHNVIGLLLCSYFVNLDIEKEDSIAMIVKKMHHEMDEIKKHMSFDCMVFVTDTNDESIISSNILYQDQLRDVTENIKNLVAEEIELPNPYYKASYYWEFEIINNRDSMDIAIYYNASRYNENTVETMLNAYRDVCEEVRDSIGD